MAERIRRLLIEVDPSGDAALVDRVDRLYAAARGRPNETEDRVVRRRVIAAGVERLRATDPERYEEILHRFHRYDQRLRRFGLRDRHLDWQVSGGDAARFAAREAAAAILLVPVALAGLVLFAVPYMATHAIARRLTREADVFATAQLFAGAAVYGAWMALLAILIGRAAGTGFGIATFVLLPVVAVAGLFAVERESAVVDAVRAWLLLRRTRRDTRERLRRSRSELAEVLDDVYEWLRESLIPNP